MTIAIQCTRCGVNDAAAGQHELAEVLSRPCRCGGRLEVYAYPPDLAADAILGALAARPTALRRRAAKALVDAAHGNNDSALALVRDIAEGKV